MNNHLLPCPASHPPPPGALIHSAVLCTELWPGRAAGWRDARLSLSPPTSPATRTCSCSTTPSPCWTITRACPSLVPRWGLPPAPPTPTPTPAPLTPASAPAPALALACAPALASVPTPDLDLHWHLPRHLFHLHVHLHPGGK